MSCLLYVLYYTNKYLACVDSIFVIKEVESCVFIFVYVFLCNPNHGSINKEHFVSIKIDVLW